MKENMEQTLKMLNQHEQNVRDTYHQNRLSLAITPVQKARIELEKAINEAARKSGNTRLLHAALILLDLYFLNG